MPFPLVSLAFVEGFTINYYLENMKLYVSDIEESYKDTIIGHLGNSGTEDLLLHVEKCWRSCAINEENISSPMVLYCSHMMYILFLSWIFPNQHTVSKVKIFTMKYSTIYHISSKTICILIVFKMVFYVQE